MPALNLLITPFRQLCAVNYIIATGLVQSLLAAALLLHRGLTASGRAILLVLMLCIAAHLGIKFSIYTVVADDAVRSQMNTCIGFCYGPLLLLYRDQLQGAPRLRRWYLFIPFIIALVGYLTVISVLTVSAEIGHLVLRRYNTATLLLLPALNACCAVLALRGLRRQGDRSGARLLLRLGVLLLAGSLLPISLSLLQTAIGAPLQIPFRSLAYLLIAAMPLTVIWELAGSYAAAKPPTAGIEPVIGEPGNMPSPAPLIAAGRPEKHITVPHVFTEEEIALHTTVLGSIEQTLQNPGMISDPDLNLERLANGAGLSRHQVSETLNHFAKQSFYDFINSRRIQRTTEQLQRFAARDIPVNMLILAFDNGFKAKSSFNAAFKKFTSKTPTEYLEGLRAGAAPEADARLILE